MRITFRDQKNFIDGRDRKNLLKHYTKHYHHVADYLARNCKDFAYLLQKMDEAYPRGFVSKDLKGYIAGFLMVRYTMFLHRPIWWGDRERTPERLFLANWFTLIQYLMKRVYALRYKKGVEIRRVQFSIPKAKLYRISKHFAEELMPIVEQKIYPKYLRMKAKQERKN